MVALSLSTIRIGTSLSEYMCVYVCVFLCIKSVERQKSLITSHLHTQLDPFASWLMIFSKPYTHFENICNMDPHWSCTFINLDLNTDIEITCICIKKFIDIQ